MKKVSIAADDDEDDIEDRKPSAYSRNKRLSVKEKVDFYENLRRQQELPPLPVTTYRRNAFSKKFTSQSLLKQPTNRPVSTTAVPIQEKETEIVYNFQNTAKYYYLVSGMTQEQLTIEFEKIYLLNPKLWDSVIDSTRFVNRYANVSELEREVQETDQNALPVINDIKPLSTDLVEEINKARLNPLAYAGVVQSRFERFVDDDVYLLPTGEYMKTAEGQEGVVDTVNYLRGIPPSPPLQPSFYLEKAALDHLTDITLNDLVGHEGSDGSTLQSRIERYCQWRGVIGENIRLGSPSAVDIVMNLLIDDGNESKGQRRNILSNDYINMGAAIGPHDLYGSCCVLNFTGNVIGNDEITTEDIDKVINTQEDLDNIDVKKILNSIPYNGDLRADILKELGNGQQVIIDFKFSLKTAKVQYVKGFRKTTRTLTWS